MDILTLQLCWLSTFELLLFYRTGHYNWALYELQLITGCGNARKGSRLAPAACRWEKGEKKSLRYCYEEGGGDISRREGLVVKVGDCATLCLYCSSFSVQTKHRCCVLIRLMIIRVTQLSSAPLLTSILLCNWSVTLRDASATEFTPTNLSSLYSLLNGCAQWHYATQDPSWLLRGLFIFNSSFCL